MEFIVESGHPASASIIGDNKVRFVQDEKKNMSRNLIAISFYTAIWNVSPLADGTT